MRRWWAVGLALLLATGAQATVLDGRNNTRGELATAQAATGASANQVAFPENWKGRWLYVDYRNASGTATVHLEVNCAPSGSASFAARWVVISGTSKSLAVSADYAGIDQPACQYRTVVDACAGCSVTTTYLAGADLQ